jgi:glutamyl-tRNA reductase
MPLLLVGISHRTAPVELRERLDFQVRGVPEALRALMSRSSVRETVVVSTCNRAEIYAVCDDAERGKADLVRFVGDFHGLDADALTPHVYSRVDHDVTRHLFGVAAGLDSLVVGEPQILGQVKEALSAATDEHSAGPLLSRLFHSSFGVGKRVRTETGLGAGAVSIGFAAVALARKIFGDLKGRNVLVVGAGEMGKLTAVHMRSQGVSRITIVSRTMAHAARTAEIIGGASVAPWEEIDAALGASDIVITATGAASPILTKARIEAVMRTRRNQPLFLIDIALPRDVEAAAADIEQVFLYNIDDLQTTVRENMARRETEVTRAQVIVNEESEKFAAWLKSRGAIPTVVALRRHFEEVWRSELNRLAPKMSSLPPEARERVEDLTHRIIEKLLLTPTEHLKALGDDPETLTACADALNRLFALEDTGAEQPSRGRVEPFPGPKSRSSSGTGR